MRYESESGIGIGAEQSGVVRLSRPVEVIVRTKAQCRADPDLEAFSVHDGPAAGECQDIIGRLCSGEAVDPLV